MKKKIITILLCIVLVIGLTGCNKKELENPYATEEIATEIATDKEVDLSIKKGTLTNTGATIVLNNKSDKEYTYGTPYTIQTKNDGKWHKINIEIDFTDTLFNIKSGETKEIELNWEQSYGKLKKGTYRIVKTFDYESEKNKSENFNLAVEFEID